MTDMKQLYMSDRLNLVSIGKFAFFQGALVKYSLFCGGPNDRLPTYCVFLNLVGRSHVSYCKTKIILIETNLLLHALI